MPSSLLSSAFPVSKLTHRNSRHRSSGAQALAALAAGEDTVAVAAAGEDTVVVAAAGDLLSSAATIVDGDGKLG